MTSVVLLGEGAGSPSGVQTVEQRRASAWPPSGHHRMVGFRVWDFGAAGGPTERVLNTSGLTWGSVLALPNAGDATREQEIVAYASQHQKVKTNVPRKLTKRHPKIQPRDQAMDYCMIP